MISETRFARSYSSVWRTLTPTLEIFVRKANLRFISREWEPLISKSAPSDRAAISRVAFSAVSLSKLAGTERELSWFGDLTNLQIAAQNSLGHHNLTVEDLQEAGKIGWRMATSLFQSRNQGLRLDPFFPGCGFINSCHGDALTDDLRFVELKDGDRPFRSYDFRQLIVYAALHLNAGGGIAKTFEVINSRRGVSVSTSFEKFASEVAGQSGFDLLSEVIRVISDVSLYQK